MSAETDRIARTIADEISCKPNQVAATVELIDGGATIPFIARYRKEATGGLDDTQLRKLEERLTYLRDLEARRATVIESISTQGKMTDELAEKISAAATKAELEDLYLPFKPKRRTRADAARERGLGPLADVLLADRGVNPEELAQGYITEDVPDVKAALEGARDILSESFAEDADLIGRLRAYLKEKAMLRSQVVEGKTEEGAKFSDYFDRSERWAAVPGHRALAMLRGRNESVLSLEIEADADDPSPLKPAERMVAEAFDIPVSGGGAADSWLLTVAQWAWRVKLSLHLNIELMSELRERAEEEAIQVFARNLKDLLLAAPAGSRATMGLDPGIRTGVKVAVTDGTGKVVETATVHPFQPRNDVDGARAVLGRLILAHKVELVAIGNGTASRETERLVADTLKLLPKGVKAPTKVVVSEAGASVYSASELAAREFPDLDVSLRGAVSIARRLQDPLAELVKIEPKSIGVGQYQHDVDQHRLTQSLEAVIEDVVNAVGVDLNTASAPLLSHVSGLGPGLAEAVVTHRDQNGAFNSRKDLLKVARLGPRAFEQCAGFLRIRDGAEPLDASAVHPEAYDVARRIVQACGRDIRQIMGDDAALKGLRPEQFVDDRFGLPTVRDILTELEKPGRDPRPSFVTASFKDGVEEIKDLKPGMVLEGTVTNVAAFGAFVDVGVHQDGLVHVGQLADRFVKDPHEVVKAGQIVRVRVVEVDVPRKRIGLSMRKDGGASARQDRDSRDANAREKKTNTRRPQHAKSDKNAQHSAFGDALKNALKNQ